MAAHTTIEWPKKFMPSKKPFVMRPFWKNACAFQDCYSKLYAEAIFSCVNDHTQPGLLCHAHLKKVKDGTELCVACVDEYWYMWRSEGKLKPGFTMSGYTLPFGFRLLDEP